MFVVARTDRCGSRRYTASSEAPCLTQGQQHKKSRFLRLCCWLYALLPYLCCNSVYTRCLTYQVLCSAVRAIPCCRAVSEPQQGETSSEAGPGLLPLLRLLCRFPLCHFLHDWHLIRRSFQVRRLSNSTILCDLRNRARCRRRAECGFEYCAERLLDRVMGGRRRHRQASSSLLVPRRLGCPLTPPGSFLALLFIIGGCGIHSDRLLFAANCATSRDRRLQRRDDRLAGSLLEEFVGSHHAVFGDCAGFEGKSLPLAYLVAILLRMWHRTGCAGFYEGKSSSLLPSFSLPSAYLLAISILPRMWYRCGCRRISTFNGRALSHAAARIVVRECPRAAR